MKFIFASVCLFLVSFAASAQTYTLDNAHSSVTFSVSHMIVSETTGRFGKFTVDFKATKPDFTDAQISAAIDVASINTENEKRDGHLKSKDFFDAEAYPQITFTSTSFTKINDKSYTLKGNLTMHGVTKTIEIPITYKGIVMLGKDVAKVGFKGSFTVDRQDYKVSWSKTLDGGGLVAGDEVTITLNIELNKK
jgi:polyisoprenoid-binding protein YceI